MIEGLPFGQPFLYDYFFISGYRVKDFNKYLRRFAFFLLETKKYSIMIREIKKPC